MRRERRKHFRVEWNSPATIYDGQLPRCCIVSNFSNGGAKIVGVKATTSLTNSCCASRRATDPSVNAACSGVPMTPSEFNSSIASAALRNHTWRTWGA
jgi:hypothetical protein